MPRQEITSPHNPRLKRAVSLRDARQRRKQERFLIDGARELRRALESGIELEEVFVCPEACQSEESRTTFELLGETSIPLLMVNADLMERIAFGGRNEGVVGIAVPPRRSLDDLSLPQSPLVAVLEGVEKPGNVGAILRSADAAGIDAVIVAESGTDLFNPNAIRASLGAIFTLPIVTVDAPTAKAWLLERGLRCFASRVDAEQLYHQVDWRGPVAIVLGSEARGLSSVWSGPEVTPVRLPMLGAVDSLNVSAAAAVLFYEAIRQRVESQESSG